MESSHRRPQHASYRLHRRQVAWQIILPVILAALMIIAAIVLVSLATFRGNGDVERWAAISTMWLTIPVMIGGLVMLAVLIGLAWAVGKGAAFIPPYSYKAQEFVNQAEARVKQGVEYAYRPMRIFPAIGRMIRSRFRKLREG